MSTLIFVETAEAAQRLVDLRRRGQWQGAAIVALSPWAEYALERYDIAFTRPEDYYTDEELEKVGLETINQVEQWCGYIDRFLRARFAPLGRTELHPGFTNFFRIKILYDALVIRLFALQRILDAGKPSRLLYFDTLPAEREPTVLDFMGESLYAHLIPLFASHAHIPVQALGQLAWPSPPQQALKEKMARLMHKNLFRSTDLLSGLARSTIHRYRLKSNDKGSILLLHPTFAKEVVTRTGFRVIWWRVKRRAAYWLSGIPLPHCVRLVDDRCVSGLRQASAALWTELARQVEFRSYFEFGGVDFFPIVEGRLRHLVTRIIPDSFEYYLTALQQFKRWGVRLVLATSLAESPERSVAQAARAAGIPVVVYDHGAMGYFYFPMDRYLDSAVADYRLVWGDGVKRSVERRYPSGAQPLSVGAVMLDRLAVKSSKQRKINRVRLCRKFGLDERRPIVIYAPTNLVSNNYYLSYLHYSDSNYFAQQRRIVGIFQDFPEIQCVIKLHPNARYPTSPIIQFISDKKIQNCQCVREIPLSEVLDLGDVFINDSPTTTLLQMLTTGKRVLVLHNRVMQFEEGALDLLKRSAVFAATVEEFEAVLRHHLENRRFNLLEGNDGEFLRQYGTHLGDGRSAERAVTALRQILAQWQPSSVGAPGLPCLRKNG